ncbi:extracytoplasmic sigma factor ECF [Gemmatimonadetes bacterium T265]|nr:extracytoplasmic sigma factor ECF [Gemmatimonadetes bacterium T265]
MLVPPPADDPTPGPSDPPAAQPGAVTRGLRAARAGDPAAWDALYTQLYDELRHLARRVRAGRAGATLSTTALVHEAYLKLDPAMGLAGERRADFFALAAWAMRGVLMDAARRHGAGKRGGGMLHVTLGEDAAASVRPDELLALDEALERLRAIDPRRARVVDYRFFAGLTTLETAELLGASVSTVERDWRTARAWLLQELGDGAAAAVRAG